MNRRLPVVVIILGLIVAALVFDGADDDTAAVETATASVDSSVFPIASDPSALSSTWFCAGGTADEEAFADHVIDIANPTDTDIAAVVTAFGGVVLPPLASVDEEDLDEPTGDDSDSDADETEGDETEGDETQGDVTEGDETEGDEADASTGPPAPVETTVVVPARSRKQLALRDVLPAPIASALVEAPAGGLLVEHEVTSIHGYDAKPCVTSAASTWHFAWGETTVDARELLVLFNPFPDDAIVDGIFSTEDGVRQPERFDGLVVPARGTVAVDLGDDVTRRQEVAATITARNGRIVVDRLLRIDGDDERGLTVQSGVPAPQRTWIYPDGFTSERTREEFVVYNPGEELAEVEIEFIVDEPEVNGIPEPIDLSLPPGTHQLVDVNADGRVPLGVAHSAVVRSANDVPVVAERMLYPAGQSRRGISVSTGSPVEAEQWNFAAGAVTDTVDEWLVLVNLDPQILTEIDVTAVIGGQLVPVSELQGIELGAGERRAIRLGEQISNRPDLSIIVTSSEPIVVERGLYQVGEDQRGISNSVGIPSPDGLREPGDPLAVEADVDLGDVDAPDDDGDTDGDDDDVPTAPGDVDLPSPDETIVIDDPDAEAEEPTSSTTSAPATTAPAASVPATTPN